MAERADGKLSNSVMNKEPNLISKLFKRQINGSDQCHRKARPQRIFKKIPKRLCYKLSSLVPQTVLEEGHVFLGFTKCGQFIVSYTCHMDAEEITGLPYYVYYLQWWWFVPSRPLIKVSEVQLFGQQDILQDLTLLFCQWPEDSTQVLLFGHSLPSGDQDQESCICYVTVTAIPPLVPCKPCQDLQSGPEDRTLCLKHSFCFHTKYELTPPFPVFTPRIQLKCDGQVILNTGDSIVALRVDLDGIGIKSKQDNSSVLKMKDGLVSDKNKDLCTSPEASREFVWRTGAFIAAMPSSNNETAGHDAQSCNVPVKCDTSEASNIQDITLVNCPESQKENTSNVSQEIACRLDRLKSPKSPKNTLSQNQRSPMQTAERWHECQNITVPTSPSQGVSIQAGNRRVRASTSTDIHSTKDLYNFDSDDSEDSSYSFMCPSVPKVAIKTKSPGGPDVVTHPHNLVISPSVHVQRQLAFSGNKTSPLLNSQTLNCPPNFESPRLALEHMLSSRTIPGIQRSFFSPSNSENSFGGTSSSAESVIVQVNDARTVTHSWRKFSYHGDTEVDSTLEIEDDFDLTYRSVLPAEVRGTKNRQLALSLDPSNDGNKEQICIKQITFDIEHYMEEAIRSSATWADRYIAFTNYDLQILDVNSDRTEVIAKVFALISAREDNKTKKFYRKSKAQEKLYQTSFVFEVNIMSGAYETLSIEDLRMIDEKDLRGKEWKPGFRECALLRRQAYIPQSARCVRVLSNASVFKGESLQMILSPEHYTAIIL
ncbi:protein ubiquitination [Mactra antiquata]